MPTLSIVIPIYNQAAYIGEMLASILRQTYTDYEIILVDDGSTDDLSAALVPYQSGIVQFIQQANAGVSAARNRGLAAAGGEYLIFLDADDWLSDADFFRMALAQLQENPHLGAVHCGWSLFSGEVTQQVRHWETWQTLDWEIMLRHAPILLLCIVFRRSAIDNITFNEHLRHAEDHDFIFQAAQRGVNFAWCPRVAYVYRLHPASSIHRQPDANAKGGYEFWHRWLSVKDLPASIQKDRDSVLAYKYIWMIAASLHTSDAAWMQKLVTELLALMAKQPCALPSHTHALRITLAVGSTLYNSHKPITTDTLFLQQLNAQLAQACSHERDRMQLPAEALMPIVTWWFMVASWYYARAYAPPEHAFLTHRHAEMRANHQRFALNPKTYSLTCLLLPDILPITQRHPNFIAHIQADFGADAAYWVSLAVTVRTLLSRAVGRILRQKINGQWRLQDVLWALWLAVRLRMDRMLPRL